MTDQLQSTSQRRVAFVAFVALSALLAPSVAKPAGMKTLAVCGASQGQAYYPYLGVVPRDKAGWTSDRTTGGETRLVVDGDGKIDIIFSDAVSKDVSVTADGGTIIPLNQTAASASFLIAYKSTGVVEVYTFFRTTDGQPSMTLVENKVGADVPVPKAAVYVATCSSLNLN